MKMNQNLKTWRDYYDRYEKHRPTEIIELLNKSKLTDEEEEHLITYSQVTGDYGIHMWDENLDSLISQTYFDDLV